MKFNSLRKATEAIERSWFAEGKPLSFMYPLFDAADTFFFSAKGKTTGSCHVRDCNDFKRMMIAVVIALLPCMLFGMYNVGLQANAQIALNGVDVVPGDWHGSILNWLDSTFPSLHIFAAPTNSDWGTFRANFFGYFVFGLVYFLPIYVVTMVVGLFWEVLFACFYKHEVNEGFFVTGALFPLIVPATIPLWQVALAISFGVVIGKEIFGGTGRNFLNPALVARAFLFFAYSGQITGDKCWVAVDGVSKATPLSCVGEGLAALKFTGYSKMDAFIGVIPGALGETSTLCCLIGAAFLLLCGIASWRIMLSMFVGGMGLASLLTLSGSETVAAYPAVALGPCWHFLLGGFAFGMVFMATDPATSATTRLGQYIYGALVGALVIVVRVFNPAYPEGVMLVILFGNCVAPLIDHFVVESNVRRRMKRFETK